MEVLGEEHTKRSQKPPPPGTCGSICWGGGIFLLNISDIKLNFFCKVPPKLLSACTKIQLDSLPLTTHKQDRIQKKKFRWVLTRLRLLDRIEVKQKVVIFYQKSWLGTKIVLLNLKPTKWMNDFFFYYR